ncbi:bifunctional folylpolyglutamate synthase/dihydrofolate synthase [Nocardioides bruguierae]|uniref:Dihydrofolate synthase/folylpolyglutamate synthase n=1 Tax=Nocardioides bruguierae TaxID=2945102 RepID=A0A9X2D6K9_9ACTN|nr:folylpolyglutamate synthase/dihydrofolate synthase family protein [Nocardioides bruguierae]MCM0619787.1 bifunctional folylpolyglutamate synthase/dihydrofolate synthase [Nocardioides bruguierae]
MNDSSAPRPAETVAEAEDALLSRWPETRLEPSLDRISALMELLGEPQRAYRAVHLTGTNGKTSTSRMIDALLRAVELRTGRFTSPHLERINERISVDGEPLDDEAFVRAFNDVAPYLGLVDEDQPHPLSFFESVVGMAYAAFADAPVDVAVVEVGMGGAWDATNVIDGDVAVVGPIAVDHAKYLGGTPEAIAHEKAGIIKEGSTLVTAAQTPEVATVLAKQAAAVGAKVVAEGVDFGVVSRTPALGGQSLSLQGLRARYDDLFLPLYGAHQAQNAAVALAAVEAFLGGSEALSPDVVSAAFADVTSPGRLEIVRRSPTVLLDAAHNPAGAEATAAALEDSFTFRPLVGVLGVMADKDVEPLLVALEPQLDHVVVTQNSTDRCLPAAELAEVAVGVFGEERVTVAPVLADAIEAAATLAEAADTGGASIGSGAVLVTGSVVTAGEARTLLAPKERPRRTGSGVRLTRGEEEVEVPEDEGGGDLSELSLQALLRDTLSGEDED